MEVIFLIGLAVAGIFIFRLFGAWMLRIDEVIKHLEELNKQIKRNNEQV